MLPVTGTVKNANGSPIESESRMVVFHPISGGKPASGTAEKDGSFTLMTKKPGDGVAPGKYKVALLFMKNYPTGKIAVPQKYGDPSTTPLEATVDAGHTHFDFKVEK
jgi:hypothetical protein